MKKYLSRKFIFSIFIISVVLISKKNVVCAYNPELVRNMPSINGSVFASVIDGDDLYIGGIFDEVGGLTRNGIAKISISTGEVDADFNPALFADSEGYGVGVVRALSLFEDYLYVGGGFRFLGTDYVGEFVRLDKNTGLMDLSCIPNVHTFWQDTVYSIYVDSTGDIYLGGSFNEVGSVHRFGLAKLTSSCSLVDGWSADLPVESLNQTIGSVNSIIGLDDYIYVGGQFSEIKGVERYNLAKVSKSDGSIDTSFVPNPSDRVYALSFYDNKLYVGGAFSEIGGVEILEFARLDPESGAVDLSCNPEVVSPPPAVEFTVGALKIDNDGNIYLGGDFVGVDGKDRYSIARLDSSCNVDETFSQGIDPDYEMNYGGYIHTISISDETLIAGGLIYHGDDGEIQSLFHWSWDNPEEEGGDSPVLGAKTFHSDKRCHYSKPPKTNWIKMEPAKKDGVSGMELTWTQYTANKINIKIDDGSDKYPWVIENSLNDGHEFLPNVSSGQKVKIQPVNWCKKGDYGDPVSYLLYPYGWYGQAVAGAVSSRANTLGYTTSPSVLGISTDSTGNGSQEAPMVPDTGRDDVLYSSISLSIIGFGIHFILNEKSRKLALKGFEKKVSKGL